MPIDPDFLVPGGAMMSPLARGALREAVTAREPAPGTRIGPYRITRELGRGGMALVYLAERADGEFEQQVALKIVLPEATSDIAQELLRRERQILAGLEHHGIARLLDGGRSDDGTLWFAMERVEGYRIDRHCIERGLPVCVRLRLFRDVCEAVQFAHSRLLIHRDIKPSNILVTGSGLPKLLDFGIAEMIAPHRQGESTMMVALTPGYASPEQRRGEAVTIASDIYQLGRLLQGMLDEDSNQRSDGTSSDSTMLRPIPTREASLTASAMLVRSDLDAVIQKAMREDPAARYATVAELQQDIDRLLAHRPVMAAQSGPGHRLRLFTRRHRGGVAATVLGLAAFVLTVTGFLVRLTAERDQQLRAAVRAQAEARRANQVSDFLSDLFKVADPGVNRGDRLTATQILDRGLEHARSGLADQPVLQANLLEVIGEVYVNLGDYARADAPLQRVVDLRRPLADAGPLGKSLGLLAWVRYKQSRFTDAATLYAEAEAVLRRVPAGDELATVLDERALLRKHEGDPGGALRVHDEALDIARRQEHVQLIATIQNHRGLLLYSMDRLAEARSAYEEALKIARQIDGERHPTTIAIEENYASLLSQLHEFAPAEVLMRQSLAAERELLGADNPEYAQGLNMLGNLLIDAGKRGAAIDSYNESLAVTGRALGNDSAQAASILANLGSAYAEDGKFERALDPLQRAASILHRLHGDGDYEATHAEAMLGACLQALGRGREAEPVQRSALANLLRALPEEHPYVVESQMALATTLLARGERDEARVLLQLAVHASESKGGTAPADLRELLAKAGAPGDRH
ncbi:MAG: serine/threonine-protein kinase [Dokdonella sp.]